MGSEAVGIEAFVKGRNMVSDMARNTIPHAKIRNIVSRNVAESAQREINSLSGQGRTRKRGTSNKRGKANKTETCER